MKIKALAEIWNNKLRLKPIVLVFFSNLKVVAIQKFKFVCRMRP